MFNSQGCQVSIRHQVTCYIQLNYETFQDFDVPFCRSRNPGGWTFQPFFYLFPGVFYRFGPFEYPRICYDS